MVYAHIRLLRRMGCTLPIEVWRSRARDGSISAAAVSAFSHLGAAVLDLDDVVPEVAFMREAMVPVRPGKKPYVLKHMALLSASCAECIFLDADNIPARDPTYLFEDESYKATGMLLWPDFWQLSGGPAPIRAIMGIPQNMDPPDARSVESGQAR